MGFLFGQKGRNETHGRRSEVAKKTASVLAAVAVAGGPVVVGMPAAEAVGPPAGRIYFEKISDSGEHLAGSEWEMVLDPEQERIIRESGIPYFDNAYKFRIKDNFNPRQDPTFDVDQDGYTYLPDEDPRDGHIRIVEPMSSYFGSYVLPNRGIYPVYRISETTFPDGFTSCGENPELPAATFSVLHPLEGLDRPQLGVVTDSWMKILDADGGIKPVLDPRFGSGNYIAIDDSWTEEPPFNFEDPSDRTRMLTLKGVEDTSDGVSQVRYKYIKEDGTEFERGITTPVHTLGAIVNCKIPEPTTVTETVTETPEPSTTTVTPPTTTVTLPSTVTTTVTPPATTVTETPKTETTTATTTESATTTVTETPQTETVTETPERETVTHTPEKETETVTETPEKETVTETPKTETVTHTPDKETVTETPKASTETKTSTVTAPQVTVTETPKQVTETTTLPQKTVTEQVPTTVVENKTETVKVPPVTVTTTEKQEPTTVTATPEKVTETVKVPGEKTTVVETKPGEPTTVRETVTETPDVPAVVEQPTPNAPVVDTPDTPVIPGAFSGTVVWDEDRSKNVNDGDERIPGLTVVAYKDGKEIARTTTDENGFYKFDNLETGEYGIAVYGPDGGQLFFEDKAATVVAGEEDTGNDWGFVREDAPAPVEEGKPATPVETVRQTLATTGANSYALAGLGAVLAALVALAVVSRRKKAIQ